MFSDIRNKAIIFVAHCIFNQNSVSDGTAAYPGSIKEIKELMCLYDFGIVQMPCPELLCLGLDRRKYTESFLTVTEENTRIRVEMKQKKAINKINQLIQDIVFQILEYKKYGFDILGIVGINRSPSCGVDTTSKNNIEVVGEGVFIEALRKELDKHGLSISIVGIKAYEAEKTTYAIKKILGANN